MLRTVTLRATVLGLAATVLIVGLILLFRPQTLYSPSVFQPMNGSAVTGFDSVKVGETVDLGLIFGKTLTNQSVVMRPVTLPRGLPKHVRLVHMGLTTGSMFLSAYGWPPSAGSPVIFPVHRLDGYVLPPGTPAEVALGFVADRPGIFVVGPFMVHAEVPGIFGFIPIGRTPVEMSYHQYVVICVRVGERRCAAAGRTVG
jgi:hypothetical protein